MWVLSGIQRSSGFPPRFRLFNFHHIWWLCMSNSGSKNKKIPALRYREFEINFNPSFQMRYARSVGLSLCAGLSFQAFYGVPIVYVHDFVCVRVCVCVLYLYVSLCIFQHVKKMKKCVPFVWDRVYRGIFTNLVHAHTHTQAQECVHIHICPALYQNCQIVFVFTNKQDKNLRHISYNFPTTKDYPSDLIYLPSNRFVFNLSFNSP